MTPPRDRSLALAELNLGPTSPCQTPVDSFGWVGLDTSLSPVVTHRCQRPIVQDPTMRIGIPTPLRTCWPAEKQTCRPASASWGKRNPYQPHQETEKGRVVCAPLCTQRERTQEKQEKPTSPFCHSDLFPFLFEYLRYIRSIDLIFLEQMDLPVQYFSLDSPLVVYSVLISKGCARGVPQSRSRGGGASVGRCCLLCVTGGATRTHRLRVCARSVLNHHDVVVDWLRRSRQSDGDGL